MLGGLLKKCAKHDVHPKYLDPTEPVASNMGRLTQGYNDALAIEPEVTSFRVDSR